VYIGRIEIRVKRSREKKRYALRQNEVEIYKKKSLVMFFHSVAQHDRLIIEHYD
jgi:hypothetical protein